MKKKVIAMGSNPLTQKTCAADRFVRPQRVKLLNLPDQAQAVVSLDGENFLNMTVYGYDSKNAPVQLEAPFKFETADSRDQVFHNLDKLHEFANAVFIAQMQTIDPELNTGNFKQLTT